MIKSRESGFTAIEMIVIVLAIGILAAIALPSYSYYINKAKKEELHSALINAKTAMLRFKMDNGHFNLSKSTGISALAQYGFEVTEDLYGSSIIITGDKINNDTTFTISGRHTSISCHLKISFGDGEPVTGSDGCNGY